MLEFIYITRHGFRSNWTTDAECNYSSQITSPTGIPLDPPLAAHGVQQAREFAVHAVRLDPKIDAIYSSPFYRCLETINPLAETLDLPIYCDNGLGEWYDVASFDHPSPALPELLQTFFFPRVKLSYNPSIIPSSYGETLVELHNRTAYALSKIINDIDKEWVNKGVGPYAILLCTHAATNITAGRVLTGNENLEVRTGTCSIGKYVRKKKEISVDDVLSKPSEHAPIPDTNWRGNGIAGGWQQVINGDCSFLKNGEERNWWFEGEKSWDFPLVDVGKQGSVSGLMEIEESSIGSPRTVPENGKIDERLCELRATQCNKEAKI